LTKLSAPYIGGVFLLSFWYNDARRNKKMAKKSTIEFKKGDANTHYFQIPVDSWTPGGLLFFTAKPQPDDDATDAAAVIDKQFDDTAVVGPSHEMYETAWVTYQLDFLPGDITNVSFADGSKNKKYEGEFQYVPDTGLPQSFPGDDEFIETIIYADIRRSTS
jgi:hypothetical protein